MFVCICILISAFHSTRIRSTKARHTSMFLSFLVQCAEDQQHTVFCFNCASAGIYRMHLNIGLLCLSVLTIPTLVLTQSDNSCFTPINEFGYCVPYQQCQFVTDLQATYGNKIPPAIQNQIRQMQCNFGKRTFHLCCPSAQVITPQSGGNTYLNKVTTQAPPTKTTPKSTNDMRRIDPSGMALLNSVKDCGKKSNIKLSGGDVTKIGEFPWLVLLKYETAGRPFLCGGSLISDRFVLTAAHCVSGSDRVIAVRMGEHNLDTEEDCQFLGGHRKVCLPPYKEYGIEDIRKHPEYKRIDNDIALIKLDRPVTFDVHIKPICLPIDSNSQDILYDQSFFISGWGRTEKNNDASSVLLKAVIQRKDLDVCRNFYIDAALTQNHICAAGDGLSHTCQGDSGGPLFFRNNFKETNRYVQYGIVSHGARRCGKNNNQPGVFASVIDMLPWITQNLY